MAMLAARVFTQSEKCILPAPKTITIFKEDVPEQRGRRLLAFVRPFFQKNYWCICDFIPKFM